MIVEKCSLCNGSGLTKSLAGVVQACPACGNKIIEGEFKDITEDLPFRFNGISVYKDPTYEDLVNISNDFDKIDKKLSRSEKMKLSWAKRKAEGK